MLLSVEDLKAARSQKDATDAAGPCGEVSRRSSPSVQDARDAESFFSLWSVMHLKSRSQAQLDFGGDALACVVPSAV